MAANKIDPTGLSPHGVTKEFTPRDENVIALHGARLDRLPQNWFPIRREERRE